MLGLGLGREMVAGGNTAFCRLMSVVSPLTIWFSKSSGRLVSVLHSDLFSPWHHFGRNITSHWVMENTLRDQKLFSNNRILYFNFIRIP